MHSKSAPRRRRSAELKTKGSGRVRWAGPVDLRNRSHRS